MATLTKLRPWPTHTMSNVNPDTRINPDWTVDGFVSEFEGRTFLALDESKDHFLCDFCSRGVPYTQNERLAGYVADLILNTGHPKWRMAMQQAEAGGRPLVPLASYCDDCATRQLYFPCEGYAEVRYQFDLSDDRVFENVEVTDVSPRDDGIPWDPKEVTEKLSGVDFDQMSLLSQILRDEMWGPENMVTWFLAVTDWEIDIRDLVRWDGSFDPKELGRARRVYESFIEDMRRKGYDRERFRDQASRGP